MPLQQLPPSTRTQIYQEQQQATAFGPDLQLADTGCWWTATNPTLGTAIALNANVTAFSDTNALFVMKNTDSASNTAAKRIYPRFIRLWLASTAPTATVSMEWAFKISYADRFPTTAANMTALTPVQINGDLPMNSVCKVASYAAAGAMTVPASGASDRTAARAHISTSLGIVGDEYCVAFGGMDWPSQAGLTATRSTAVARLIGNAAPVVLGPGQSMVCHMWWLTSATNAATFEFELGWIER